MRNNWERKERVIKAGEDMERVAPPWIAENEDNVNN